jgi:hypothetical protein
MVVGPTHDSRQLARTGPSALHQVGSDDGDGGPSHHEVEILHRDGSGDPAARSTRLVLSGGCTGGPRSEAAVMAAYARAVRGHQGPLVLEEASRSAWENVTNVLPQIDTVDQIKIVSHPMHALKARAYLLRQRPDLTQRLVRGGDYRFGEWLPLKPLLALYGRWTLRRVSTNERRRTTR